MYDYIFMHQVALDRRQRIKVIFPLLVKLPPAHQSTKNCGGFTLSFKSYRYQIVRISAKQGIVQGFVQYLRKMEYKLLLDERCTQGGTI